MTDERTLDRLIAHLRAQVAELRRREEEGAGADEVAERKRLILRLQEHLSYAVRDLLRAQEDVAARVVTPGRSGFPPASTVSRRGKAEVPSGRCNRHGSVGASSHRSNRTAVGDPCRPCRPCRRARISRSALIDKRPVDPAPTNPGSEERRASGAEPCPPAPDVQSLHRLAPRRILKGRGTVPRAPGHLLWKQCCGPAGHAARAREFAGRVPRPSAGRLVH